jgi:adenosine deaminase
MGLASLPHVGAPAAPAEGTWNVEWIRGLPKAEVHCHLEGCISPELVRAAALRRGATLPWEDAAAASPTITNLAELLGYLDVACGLMDRPEDLASVAYAAARHAGRSGTRHLDVIVTPFHWQAWHGRLEAMVDAFDAGFREAESDGHPPACLCLSINRRQSASAAGEMVSWMVQRRHPRVVALSIDGNEVEGSNNERFVEAFSVAAESGFHRCAHAGESSGPEGVRAALELLGVERVDHGIRAVEDPRLVSELVKRQVPLDVCPTSNRRLGITPDPRRHPLEALRIAGVRISLNTDDPLVYDCDVAGEYAETAEIFGWDRDVIVAVARTSIEASFAPEERKRQLVQALDAYALSDL